MRTNHRESRTRKLLSIASPSLGRGTGRPNLVREIGSAWPDLAALLSERNGFFAFESALHVFPLAQGSRGYDLVRWNQPGTWRRYYGGLADGLVFFAEDLFGGQWGLTESGVVRFDPETGATEAHADSLEEWASRILGDYEVETGWPLAREWQRANRSLAENERLIPRQLFVLGGAYDITNLKAVDAAEGMRIRGPIAQKLACLPDDAVVSLEVVP